MTSLSFLRIASPTLTAMLLVAMLSGPAWATSVRLAASDDRGVTLQLTVPEHVLSPVGSGDRAVIEGTGLSRSRRPGRPHLPFAATLVAIPPGTRATARVIASGPEIEEVVSLAIAGTPGFREDPALGVVPTIDDAAPIEDGPWPASLFEIEEPFSLRRQQVVVVRLHPFRYDAASSRLWSRRTLTVRVDFVGAESFRSLPVSDDRHWEPVLKSTLINYEQGRRWRLEPIRPTRARPGLLDRVPEGARSEGLRGAAFDEDEPEVRVRIDTTGVYAFEYEKLVPQGFPANVPVAEVSVHRHEFVENQTPTYVTIELPIEIDDRNQDGIFNAGDRILLFVQNWAERSKVSFGQRLWGDGEVVYVTRLRGRPGLRMGSRPGWHNLTLPSLSSYPWLQHWEENRFYLPGFQPGRTDTNSDLFHWTDIGAYFLPDSFRFEINDLDTSKAARFWLRWEGRKANNHINWAHIRNASNQITSLADSVFWSGRGPFTHPSTVNGSALSSGNRNVLRIWGKTNPGDSPATGVVNAGFNWFEIEYWRSFRALAGYLPMNSAGASSNFQITATDFATPGIRVYDVTDSLMPARMQIPDSLITQTGTRYSVRFQDVSLGGATRRYVAFDQPKRLPAERYQTVVRRDLGGRASGEYLMIVPEALLDAVEPLRAHRQAQGLDVLLAPLEAVNDEFNGGRHSAHSIRRFVRYAFNNWNASFVMLVGDGSEDPQNHLGNSGKDWVPAPKIGGPVTVHDGTSSVLETVPSDPWYVWCVNCADPSRSDRVHDLFIGRLPVNSVQETRDVVTKLIDFERVTPAQTWRRRMLLLADDKYSTTSFFGGGGSGGPEYCRRGYEQVFVDINQACRDVILNEAMLIESDPEVFDLGYYLRNEPVTVPSPGDTCRVSWTATQQRAHATVTPEIIQRLNRGVLWWNFQGHANQYVMTHEDIYVNRGLNDDKNLLMNTGKLFLFSAFACHPNGFAVAGEGASNRGPSFGEELVTLPNNRGAVASWGSSGFEILPSRFGDHLNVHFARALFSSPPRDAATGEAHALLGASVAQALVENLVTTNFSLERQVGVTYHLLGDPATRFSIGASQFLVTANGQPVLSGQPVRLFSFGDTLRLEAKLVSNVALRSISLERVDGNGTVVIPPSAYTLSPTFPDTSAGGDGGRLYRMSYMTVVEAGSFRYTIRTVDRDGVAGQFDVVFQFQTVLRSRGAPLADGDPVAPDASLSLYILSPGQLAQKDFELTLRKDGGSSAPIAFDAMSDTTGREWTLSWSHPPYAPGAYQVELSVAGTVSATHTFRVESRMGIENAMAFPNPFDDQTGTRFSFTLASTGPADLLIRIFTVSGRLIQELKKRALMPGYHQLAWDGRDKEGQKLANGIYLYRLIARAGDETVRQEGRLVKLRKPRRVEVTDGQSP